MSTQSSDPIALMRAIEQAGSLDAYVRAQLTERGYLVPRRETDAMSDRERAAYKKSLKEEAAERRRLSKEAWKAYRQRRIVHLGETIAWVDSEGVSGRKTNPDRYDLPDAEERVAENALPALETPQQLAEAMGLSVPQLRSFAYHREASTFLHYRRFTIPKGDGSERPIWAPLPGLKAAQRWILTRIAERLPVHGAAHGFLPGRSILTNAEPHRNSQLVVKMDLKDFFPTITWRRVKGVFRKAGYREQVSTLLALICTEAPREIVEHDGTTYYIALGPRCLPQGAPTSPALTNAICFRLDRRLTGLADALGYRYTRYADDMTFSLPASEEADGRQPDRTDHPKRAPSPEKTANPGDASHEATPSPNGHRLGRLLGAVRRIVEDEGFQLHPDKTRIARSGARQSVTGLIVNGASSPRVPREVRRRLRAAIHNRTHGRPIKGDETDAQLAGLAAHIYMTDPIAGRAMLDALGTYSNTSEVVGVPSRRDSDVEPSKIPPQA